MASLSLSAPPAPGSIPSVRGMTLRELALARFFDLLDAYREARGHLQSPVHHKAVLSLPR